MGSTTDTLSLKLALSGLAGVQAGLRSLTNTIGSIKSAVLPLAGALLGIQGVRGVGGLAKDVLELGSQLKVLKQRAGATIPELMAIQKLLEQSGGSAGDAEMLLRRMSNSIAEAAENGGPLAKAFEDIHLNAEKLSGMSSGAAFKAIALGIAGMDGEFKKTQVSMKILGRTGDDVKVMFSELKRVEAAYAGESAFKAVMERSAPLFQQAKLSLRELSENGVKFMAGFLDQVLPMFEQVFQKFNDFDLTGLGQKFGAWVVTVVEFWKKGRLDEIIGLTIQAGFEQGEKGLQFLWVKVLQIINSDTFKLIGTTLSMQIIGALTTAFIDFSAFLGKLFVDVALEFTKVMDRALTAVLNGIVDFLNNVMLRPGGTPLKRFSRTATLEDDAAKQKAEIDTGAEMLRKGVKGFFDEGIGAAKQLWGALGATGQGTASAQLNALLNQTMARRAAEAPPASGGLSNPPITFGRQIQELKQQEDDARKRLIDLQSQVAMLEGDFTKTEVAKWTEKKGLLLEERATLEKIVELIKKRAALEFDRDPAAGQKLSSSANSEQGKIGGVDRDIGKLGADPNSWSQQFSSATTSLFDQFGTLAQRAASSFKSVFTSAVSTISNGITGLIMGTQSWGQALAQIGTTILTSVVQAIIQMGVEYVATHGVMASALAVFHAIASALGWKSAGEVIAQETSKAPVLATNATTASISSYGGAAIAGIALLVAALGVGIAAATGAFREGGYTGNMGVNDIAGVVHGREFVMPAHAVSRIGLPALEAAKSGDTSGLGYSGAGGGSSVHVHYWDDKSAMTKHIRENPEVRHAVLDIVKKNSHQFLPRR